MPDDAAEARRHLDDHLALAGRVAAEFAGEVEMLARVMRGVFGGGGRLYTFGNGGSACDALHFAEELIGRFKAERRPLPAVSLVADSAALTCIANDYGYENVFARQLAALARPGDLAVALSTSGNSENVLRGLRAAREAGAGTVLFSAGAGGRCAAYADRLLLIPATSTARIQEMHILLIHVLCQRMDDWLLETRGPV